MRASRSRRPPVGRAAVVALLLLGGCATATTLRLPGRIEGLPDGSHEADVIVTQARALSDRDDETGALRLVESALARWPEHVDGTRLRQDLMRARGRTALLRYEAEQRLDADPGSAAAHYLAGRIAPTAEARLDAFRRATELAPESAWGWLGIAFTLRESTPEIALPIYARLVSLSRQHGIVLLGFGAALLANKHYDAALEVYARLRDRPEQNGAGELGIARSLLGKDLPRLAWAPLLKALQAIPHDGGVHELLQQFLSRGLADDQIDQVLDTLQSRGERLTAFAQNGGATVLAAFHERAGDFAAARAALERDGGPPGAPAARRLWRRVVLGSGNVREWLADLRATFPHALLADETNQLRAAWRTLLEGSFAEAADPLASATDAVALVRALAGVGMLEEAERIASLARLRHRDGAAAERAQLESITGQVSRELAFERALRRVVYSGYGEGTRPRGLREVLAELRRISVDVFERDVVGSPKIFKLPWVGEMVDPFAPGIGTHVASFNRHLLLGQRSGRPVEALLLTRLSLRDLPDEPRLPLPGRCFEVIGEDREIRGISSVYGGDLAGIALFNHYVIDLDSVREWARGIEDKRRIARQDGRALLADPMPREIARHESLDVQWRLGLVSPEQDSELEAAVLDQIRWHERAHLVDSFHYLPVEGNLWRVLGLLFRGGFSASWVEGEMEARAETAALALSPHPQLVLAHIAGFLDGEARGSPHAIGFRRLADRVVAAARQKGLAGAEPHLWHQLDPDAARAIGQELLAELW